MNAFNIKSILPLIFLISFSSTVLSAAEETESALDFTSRERLIETLVETDEQAQTELTDAQTVLNDAQNELSDAQTALDSTDKDATTEEIAALEQQLADAEQTVATAETDVEAAELNLASAQENQDTQLEQIDELSDEQVFALNRSLNNAVNNNLIGDLDGAFILQSVVEGDYNKLQINSLTKALEEEAKFATFSDKFQAKYDESSNEKFLEISDRMLSRGEMQKEKFLAKIDKFSALGDKGDFSKESAKNQVKELAKLSAKNEAKGIAKKSALDNVKKSAKTQAKLNAKNVSKQIIKEEGRNTLKENGRRARQGQGRS